MVHDKLTEAFGRGDDPEPVTHLERELKAFYEKAIEDEDTAAELNAKNSTILVWIMEFILFLEARGDELQEDES